MYLRAKTFHRNVNRMYLWVPVSVSDVYDLTSLSFSEILREFYFAVNITSKLKWFLASYRFPTRREAVPFPHPTPWPRWTEGAVYVATDAVDDVTRLLRLRNAIGASLQRLPESRHVAATTQAGTITQHGFNEGKPDAPDDPGAQFLVTRPGTKHYLL